MHFGEVSSTHGSGCVSPLAWIFPWLLRPSSARQSRVQWLLIPLERNTNSFGFTSPECWVIIWRLSSLEPTFNPPFWCRKRTKASFLCGFQCFKLHVESPERAWRRHWEGESLPTIISYNEWEYQSSFPSLDLNSRCFTMIQQWVLLSSAQVSWALFELVLAQWVGIHFDTLAASFGSLMTRL